MFYLREVNFKFLGAPEPEPIASPNAWFLASRCTDDKSQTCDLLEQILQMPSRSDQKAALQSVHKLIKVAANGLPLQNFYDEKQCHEIHSFLYMGKERRVWRIRQGDVRLLFVYSANRLIYLPLVISKRKDKLSVSDKAQIEATVKPFMDAEATQQLCIIADQTTMKTPT